MKATFNSLPKPLLDDSPKFGWVKAKKIAGGIHLALVTPYGAVFINEEDGDVTYSSRDYFDRNYTVLENYPDATFHLKLKG